MSFLSWHFAKKKKIFLKLLWLRLISSSFPYNLSEIPSHSAKILIAVGPQLMNCKAPSFASDRQLHVRMYVFPYRQDEW